MQIGDLVKATAKKGLPIITGKYVGDQALGYLGVRTGRWIEQADGVVALVRDEFFDIEVIQSQKTTLQIELLEIIAQFCKDGYTDSWIKESFRRVWEGLK